MKRFKKYSFWVAFSGAIIILVDCVCRAFGYQFDSAVIESIIMSICGVLVVLGIVVKDDGSNNTKIMSSKKNKEEDIKTDMKEEDSNEICDESVDKINDVENTTKSDKNNEINE